MSTPVKGDMLMIFLDNDYHSMLYSRSHSLSVSIDTQNVQYHSNDRYAYPDPARAYWEMEAELICTEEELDSLFTTTINRQKIIVMFGQAANYNINGGTDWVADSGYRGKAIIESFEVTANTGDTSTINIKFKGVTSLEYASKNDPFDIEGQQYSPSKKDPNISFDHDHDDVGYDPSNTYDISDLNNPNELSIRYIVLPYKGRLLQDVELIEDRAVWGNSEIISTISLSALSPGTYTIVAIFDGNDEYNPSQVVYTITIGEGQEEQPKPTEPISWVDDSNQKYDPIFYYQEESETYPQNIDGSYRMQYLTNPANLDFTWQLPNNVTIVDGKIHVDLMGEYTIRAIFAGDDYYNAATAEYTLVITEPIGDVERENAELSWINPPSIIEYNGTGIYQLPELYNPLNLPVTITCSNPNVTISGNNIIAEVGDMFTITATFAGNSYYYPASASFSAVVTRPMTEIILYWENDTMTATQNENGQYQMPNLVNPLNVPVTISISPSGPSIANGILSTDTYGTYTITASFAGDLDHYSKTATMTYEIEQYIKITPELYWDPNSVMIEQTENSIYTIPSTLINTLNLPVTITLNPEYKDYHRATLNGNTLSFVHAYPDSTWYLPPDFSFDNYTECGIYTVTASFAGNWYYNAVSATLTIEIYEHVKVDPPIWWPQSSVTIRVDEYPFTIPRIVNDENLTLTYSSIYNNSDSTISIQQENAWRTHPTITASFGGNWDYNSYSTSMSVSFQRIPFHSSYIFWTGHEIYAYIGQNNGIFHEYESSYFRSWPQPELSFALTDNTVMQITNIEKTFKSPPQYNKTSYDYTITMNAISDGDVRLYAYYVDHWKFEDGVSYATRRHIWPKSNPILEWSQSYAIPYPLNNETSYSLPPLIKSSDMQDFYTYYSLVAADGTIVPDGGTFSVDKRTHTLNSTSPYYDYPLSYIDYVFKGNYKYYPASARLTLYSVQDWDMYWNELRTQDKYLRLYYNSTYGIYDMNLIPHGNTGHLNDFHPYLRSSMDMFNQENVVLYDERWMEHVWSGDSTNTPKLTFSFDGPNTQREYINGAAASDETERLTPLLNSYTSVISYMANHPNWMFSFQTAYNGNNNGTFDLTAYYDGIVDDNSLSYIVPKEDTIRISIWI